MSIKALDLTWSQGPDHPLELLVMLVLADQAGYKHELYLDVPHIAARSRLSEPVVDSIIQILRSKGWIKDAASGDEAPMICLAFFADINEARLS